MGNQTEVREARDMTEGQIFMLVVSAFPTLAVAILVAQFNRFVKKQDERHADITRREALLCERRLDSGELLLETSKAVRDKRSNGHLNDAIVKFEATHGKYEAYVRNQVGERMADQMK
jgi:hypothetical protein